MGGTTRLGYTHKASIFAFSVRGVVSACLSRSRLRLPQGSHARHVARIVAPSIEHLLFELLRQQHLPTLRLLLTPRLPVAVTAATATATAVAATATAVAVAATAEEGSGSGIVREAGVTAVAARMVALLVG